MIPYLTLGDLRQLPPKAQRKICACEKTCEQVVWFSTKAEEWALCESDAREFVNRTMTILQWHPHGWNEEAEQMVIDHVKEHGFSNYRLIAEKLNRNPEVIKRKIYRMRDSGRLHK